MKFVLFLSLVITTFYVSSSSYSYETFSPYQRNLGTFKLTPNASPNTDQASPIFSDRTHKPDSTKNNSLENSPEQNLLSPLLIKRRNGSLSDDNFSQNNCSIKISDEDSKNTSADNDKNSISTNISTSSNNNICSKTICGYDRNKVIIAGISLTVFTSGILCLLLIKD